MGYRIKYGASSVLTRKGSLLFFNLHDSFYFILGARIQVTLFGFCISNKVFIIFYFANCLTSLRRIKWQRKSLKELNRT